jgi:hypothetical protein
MGIAVIATTVVLGPSDGFSHLHLFLPELVQGSSMAVNIVSKELPIKVPTV